MTFFPKGSFLRIREERKGLKTNVFYAMRTCTVLYFVHTIGSVSVGESVAAVAAEAAEAAELAEIEGSNRSNAAIGFTISIPFVIVSYNLQLAPPWLTFSRYRTGT